MADADAALVQGALNGLGRALARIAADHPANRGIADPDALLEPVLAALRAAMDKFGTVTVAVEPGALRFEGERVFADDMGATGFCSRPPC